MDDRDRNRFLEGLGTVTLDSDSTIYAFALISNHFHILIKRGPVPLANIMRRLLTSHAAYINKRHDRVGHLFQNRYKAIIGRDESHIFELIRYINLNPVKAGECAPANLQSYAYGSHSYILRNRRALWFDADSALSLLSSDPVVALQEYMEIMRSRLRVISKDCNPAIDSGFSQGVSRDTDSHHDHAAAAAVEEAAGKKTPKSSTFLNTRLSEDDLIDLLNECSSRFLLTVGELLGTRRSREISSARIHLAQRLTREFGLTPIEVAEIIGVTRSAVAKMLKKGSQVPHFVRTRSMGNQEMVDSHRPPPPVE